MKQGKKKKRNMTNVWLFIWCKFYFLKKYLWFLQNIRYLQEKMFLYRKKKIIEKNINENVKKIYLISEINKQKINLS